MRADAGVPGVLADPQMSLYSNSTVIDSSDNWQDHSRADEIPESLRPVYDLEATIYTELEPGVSTAIVSAVNGTTGVAIVEVFEVQ